MEHLREKGQQIKAVTYFYKKIHHRSLTRFLMRLWWWLLLATERAFPIKQRLFCVLAKKTQHLFLTMAVPIKCMIKCNVENKKSCVLAWKIQQRKLNEMKTWICRQGTILFVPMHPLCQCFPVIFSNHSASILQPYSLPYSEPCQKSKMESFTRIFTGKNSIPFGNL